MESDEPLPHLSLSVTARRCGRWRRWRGWGWGWGWRWRGWGWGWRQRNRPRDRRRWHADGHLGCGDRSYRRHDYGTPGADRNWARWFPRISRLGRRHPVIAASTGWRARTGPTSWHRFRNQPRRSHAAWPRGYRRIGGRFGNCAATGSIAARRLRRHGHPTGSRRHSKAAWHRCQQTNPNAGGRNAGRFVGKRPTHLHH